MRRLIMVTAAIATMAVPTVLAVTTVVPSASASGFTCAKMKGTAAGSVEVLKCSVAKADKHTYKSLNAASALTLASGGALTWSSSGATVTIGTPTTSTPANNICPGGNAKQTIINATGTITQGDGKYALTGDTFNITVCEKNKGGKLTLAPGTVAQL